MSVAKSLTGALAGVLISENKLDPNTTVSQYIPELKNLAYGPVTINQLLNMTSGIQWSEDITNPKAEVTIQEHVIGWRPPIKGLTTSNHEFIKSLKASKEHDGSFVYKSADNDVLAWVMEQATKKSYPELISYYLWSKLGVEQDGQFTVDGKGAALSDGGFNASLRDYGRFGQMILNNGYYNHQQIVPATWVATFRQGDMKKFKHYSQFIALGAYSNQWWVMNNKTGVFSALGIYGQYIYINPKAYLVIVKLSSWPKPMNVNWNYDFYNAAEAIAKHLGES